MPVSTVTQAVIIAGRAFEARASVWKCDGCGREDAYDARLDDCNHRESEGEPQRVGWRINWRDDGATCMCPTCVACHTLTGVGDHYVINIPDNMKNGDTVNVTGPAFTRK